MKKSLFIYAVLLCALAATTLNAQVVDEFQLGTITGGEYSFPSGDFKVAVITFFTTYCTPCTQEHPHLQRMYDDYKDDGLEVFAISSDEPGNRSKVRLWKRRYHLEFPILLDVDFELTRRYNPAQNFPLTMIVDSSGEIQHIYQGYTPGDEVELEQDLKALLEK